jgi:O-succinylbenzoate synthase
MSLLAGDVTADPLASEAGELPVRRPAVDPGQLARWEADPAPWRERAAAAVRFLPDPPGFRPGSAGLGPGLTGFGAGPASGSWRR